MGDLKFLDSYSGQTTEQLIQLENEFRIDSLVLAFEQALDQKSDRVGYEMLSKLEKAILCIEALEREVNNGGFDQFFVNTAEYAKDIVESLKLVGCSKTAELAQKAIDALNISSLSIDMIEDVIYEENEEREQIFEELDSKFFDYEDDISGVLFSCIKSNRSEVKLS